MTSDGLKDYYAVLGIERSAGLGDIHKAYLKMASRCHPDKGGCHEDMTRIVEAWKILSDPVKRARYDQLLSSGEEGWHNRKFDEDLRDASREAEQYDRSWSDFEAVYQEALYNFNKDFYGPEVDLKANGPYSPLMSSGQRRSGTGGGAVPVPEPTQAPGGRDRVFRLAVVALALVALIILYHHNRGIGRYVPVAVKASQTMIMDSTNGVVYTLTSRDGLSPAWLRSSPPVPGETGLK
jgi:hypothetical protein